MRRGLVLILLAGLGLAAPTGQGALAQSPDQGGGSSSLRSLLQGGMPGGGARDGGPDSAPTPRRSG